jgi:hypothetical protein
MAITINGTGTITGISAGGLPDGSVTAADIESSLDLTGKTVTLPSGTGGKILQVQYNSTSSTGQQACSANTDTPFSFLTVDITPSSTNSKIIVSYSLMGEWNTTAFYNGMAFLSRRVGGTHNYLRAPAANNRTSGLVMTTLAYNADNSASTPEMIEVHNYQDSPSTTNQITYFPAFFCTSAATWWYNRTVSDADTNGFERGVSWIMAMEVAG